MLEDHITFKNREKTILKTHLRSLEHDVEPANWEALNSLAYLTSKQVGIIH